MAATLETVVEAKFVKNLSPHLPKHFTPGALALDDQDPDGEVWLLDYEGTTVRAVKRGGVTREINVSHMTKGVDVGGEYYKSGFEYIAKAGNLLLLATAAPFHETALVNLDDLSFKSYGIGGRDVCFCLGKAYVLNGGIRVIPLDLEDPFRSLAVQDGREYASQPEGIYELETMRRVADFPIGDRVPEMRDTFEEKIPYTDRVSLMTSDDKFLYIAACWHNGGDGIWARRGPVFYRVKPRNGETTRLTQDTFRQHAYEIDGLSADQGRLYHLISNQWVYSSFSFIDLKNRTTHEMRVEEKMYPYSPRGFDVKTVGDKTYLALADTKGQSDVALFEINPEPVQR